MFSGIGGCHYTVSVLFLQDDSTKPAKPMIPTTIIGLPDAQMLFCIMLIFYMSNSIPTFHHIIAIMT